YLFLAMDSPAKASLRFFSVFVPLMFMIHSPFLCEFWDLRFWVLQMLDLSMSLYRVLPPAVFTDESQVQIITRDLCSCALPKVLQQAVDKNVMDFSALLADHVL